ncbi:protein NO VEIN domain-containing protein [Sinomonas atrocyanea]|uniref:protein NO VEIN domain-containing protein n=1 Tax=Sinomonas atrocyanea TaxID=37927 RepID=UPI001E38D2C1|nr:DUF3883 domain-containing protein [Sinomonas atrocyanea]
MVINIRLIDRQAADPADPLGRDWWGYDPDVTPEVLWANNRGDWRLDRTRIAVERWAAFNYQDRVVLVAELDGPEHETVPDMRTGKPKRALIGRPLSAGHPVHEALIGAQVEYRRNPISYGPDPVTVEAAATAENPDLPRGAGQGRQMDPGIRRAIEDAAQDRLMDHYRNRGWTVTDTRLNRPYDAVALRGFKRLYLEAKGTQSLGGSVVVTRNEVEHARQHPGMCFMGVWSGMRLVDGKVDRHAGEFRVVRFDPDEGRLNARDFDWTVPEGTS